MFVNLCDVGLTPSVTFHLKNRWNTQTQVERNSPHFWALLLAPPPHTHMAIEFVSWLPLAVTDGSPQHFRSHTKTKTPVLLSIL